MPYAETARLKIYYECAGTGPKLVFIGGVGGDLRSQPNILDSRLAEHFSLLAFDQRGTGRTDKPQQEYTMLDYCKDAVTLMDHHHWNRAHIVGVSFGGMVAQELAIAYPQRVNGLVLACTTAGGKGGSSYPLHELADLPADERARKLLGIADLRKNPEWQRENPLETQKLLQQAAADASPFLSEPGGTEGLQRQIQARRYHDTYDRLHRIQTPTLICAGRYDGQAGIQAIKNMHKKIADAKLSQFEGGHGFLGQDPAAFEEICRFLLELKT